jgi:hypothetical protein
VPYINVASYRATALGGPVIDPSATAGSVQAASDQMSHLTETITDASRRRPPRLERPVRAALRHRLGAARVSEVLLQRRRRGAIHGEPVGDQPSRLGYAEKPPDPNSAGSRRQPFITVHGPMRPGSGS